MVAKNLLDRVLSLPTADRMELLHTLRENLRNEAHRLTLTEEQKRLLDERLCEFESDPEEGSPWEKVEGRLRSNIGGK